MAKSSANRKTFSNSCAAFIEKYNFDGVDLDWEYPVENGLEGNARDPADGGNYTLLCQDIRAALDALTVKTKRVYLLTIAAPAGPANVRHLESAKLGNVLDFMNVMTYDYRGASYSSLTGHQTPLYPSTTDPDKELGCTAQIVDTFINSGFPAGKIVIGAAMYGRGFMGVTAGNNNGLFTKFTGTPMGTWDAQGNEGATGVFDYKDIVGRNLPRFWDDQVKAPWVYDGNLMISYDDPQSIKEKCMFIQSKGIGGIMFWELAGDIKSGTTGSLLDTAVASLT